MLGDAGNDAKRGTRPRAQAQPRARAAIDAIKRLLRRRLAVVLIAVFGAALVAPSLSNGLQTEDFAHSLMAQNSPWYANLFGSVGAPPAGVDSLSFSLDGEEVSKLRRRSVYAAKDIGALPWVASPDWRVAFWRPLASWTHHFDYTVLADWPWAMHAHSIAWYFLLVAVVGFLFRRLTSSLVVASVATFIYAVDESHGVAVGWLANRNALMATVFGVAALIVHDAWRGETSGRAGGRGWRWLLPLVSGFLLFCAVSSGEIGVGAFAYVLAHALTIDRHRWRRRMVALVPAVVAGLMWAVPYRLGGYGAHGSGVYVDPVAHPFDFLAAVGSRLPTTVSASLSGFPPEMLAYAKWENGWVLVLELAVIVLAAFVLMPLFRHAKIRFWALGLLLSALPICAVGPAGRTLFFTTLGAFALLAEIIGMLARTPHGLFARRAWRVPALVTAVVLVLPNTLFAVGMQPLASVALKEVNEASLTASDDLFDGHGDPDQYLFIVNAPAYYSVNVLFGVRQSQGGTLPHHVRVLYAGLAPITVERPLPTTLTIHAPDGFVTEGADDVYRPPHVRFKKDDLLPLSGVLMRVDEVDEDGMATKVTFRFGRPLSDELYRFVTWSEMRFQPFEIPAVGERLELRGALADLKASRGN